MQRLLFYEEVSKSPLVLLNYIWNMSVTLNWRWQMLLPQLTLVHKVAFRALTPSCSHIFTEHTSDSSLSFECFDLRPDIGTGPQGASMMRPSSPRMETRRPPWVGRCTRGAGRHRCRQSWRCSARIWSQALWRAVMWEGGGEWWEQSSQGLNEMQMISNKQMLQRDLL